MSTSTDDHGPTHTNGFEQDAVIAAGSPTRLPLHETSTMTAANTDSPCSVTPHPEDHTSDDGMFNNASVTPAVLLIPQTVPLHTETKPELSDEEAANTPESRRHSESAETNTNDEEDEVEGDEDENENENEEEEEDEDDEGEDDDEEPALKYERFGGVFQDLLKKDSASALAVSNRYLVSDVVLAQRSPPTFLCRHLVRTMGLRISWT